MRILFADPLDDHRIDRLRKSGHDCVVKNAGAEELPGLISGFDALVVRSTKVTADVMAAGDRLSLIVRAGAGTDNIDLPSASAAGVYVCNVPGRNAIAVAELTIGLLLAVDRQVSDGVADLRAGRWNKSRYAEAEGIFGKRLAIIGLGDVGLAVAERAKAFGMPVSAVRRDGRSSTTQSRIRSIGIRLVDSQEELLADADVVSLHVPKSPDTVDMVNPTFLSSLPDGAIILNTSRGDVVNEAALLTALDTREMRAGLDVFPGEPTEGSTSWESPLAQHPSVVGSHHIGASTRQAQESVAEGVVEVLTAFHCGEPKHCLNLVLTTGDTQRLKVRHLDKVGVLAKVLNVIGHHGLNVQQMQNQVFEGGTAAVATINVHGEITGGVLEELATLDEVIAAGRAG